MSGHFKSILFYLLILNIFLPHSVNGARIKDIAAVKGIRSNQLFGYGLIIGLNGSGDKDGTTFTIQGLVNMLEKMGIRLQASDVKIKNVAAVMVNATLPPFARIGKKIDVVVSSIGDAKSLQGGTLLLTPLKGVDGKIYAIAQGPISVGGYSAGGAAGGGVTKNHPTVARISGGATVEREVPLSLKDKRELTIILNNADFITATRTADAINLRFGDGIAKAVDSGTLKINIPENFQGGVVSLLAQLEEINVSPDSVEIGRAHV